MVQRTFVISSDAKNLGILNQIFEELGATCQHSHDLAAAITTLSAEPFDAVLVDCDDLQNATLIFNCLRTSSANRGAMTVALVDGVSVPMAFRLGAKTVLSKPLSLDQARNTLRTALAVQRREAESHPAKAFAAAASAIEQISPASTEPIHVVEAEEAVTAPTAVVPEPAAPKFEPISLSSGSSTMELASSATSGGAATAPAKSRNAESAKPHLVTPAAVPSNREQAKIHEVVKPAPIAKIAENASETSVADAKPSPAALDSLSKSSRGLTIALMVVLLVVSGAGVWMTQPKLRNAILWEYGKLLHHSQSAQKTVAPVTPAPVVTQPVAVAPPPPPAAQGFQETPPPPRPVTAVTVISADPIIIAEEMADAHIAHSVAPWYPTPARKAHLKDSVILDVNVAADGTVQSASAQSGDPQLRLAAEEAVKQWQYQPYYQDGQAVQFQTQATVAFPPVTPAPAKP
jgi:periplasmic protein TonB